MTSSKEIDDNHHVPKCVFIMITMVVAAADASDSWLNIISNANRLCFCLVVVGFGESQCKKMIIIYYL